MADQIILDKDFLLPPAGFYFPTATITALQSAA